MKEFIAVILVLAGIAAWIFAIVDFAGMFFGYDLTGSRYSPMIAGFVGSILFSLGTQIAE